VFLKQTVRRPFPVVPSQPGSSAGFPRRRPATGCCIMDRCRRRRMPARG